MVRYKLTKEERRIKLREGRRGWGSTRGMKRGEYIEWRNREMEKKGKVKEEREKKWDEERAKKEAEKRRKEMQNTAKTGVTPPKWKARGKLLILVVIIAIIVYLILKYSG